METSQAYLEVAKARSPWRPMLATTGTAVGCGLVLAAAFPPLGYWFLAPLAIAGLFSRLHHTPSVRLRLAAAWAGGFTFFFMLMWWMRYFGVLPWVLLAALEGASLPLVVLVVLAAGPRPGWPRALAVGAAWVGLEWLRAQGSYGFAWGQLGVAMAAAPALAQGAAWLGSYGLSCALVVTGALLAEWGYLPARSWARQVGVALAALAVLAAGSWWQYGAVIRGEAAARSEAQGMTVALVQGSLQQMLRAGELDRTTVDESEQGLQTYEALTRRALDESPYLVVWPESATLHFAEEEPEVRERLGALAREGGCWLLAGGPASQGPDLRNSALLFGPDGAYAGRYDKVHLVPFGEFVPGRGKLPLVDRYPVRGEDITPGPGHSLLDAGGIRLGVLICFESIFPEISRSYAGQGADLLVMITNDAWFGRSAALRQHAQMAVLRAIESGRWVARAAYAGISQVIDPAGRVVGELGPGRRAVLARDVYPSSPTTAYGQVGYLFAPLCLAVALGWALVGAVGRRMLAGGPAG